MGSPGTEPHGLDPLAVLDPLDGPGPLDDPGGVGHTSLESLLGGCGGSTGSASSRRSSADLQTQSTEQSWSLDLTD